ILRSFCAWHLAFLASRRTCAILRIFAALEQFCFVVTTWTFIYCLVQLVLRPLAIPCGTRKWKGNGRIGWSKEGITIGWELCLAWQRFAIGTSVKQSGRSGRFGERN